MLLSGFREVVVHIGGHVTFTTLGSGAIIIFVIREKGTFRTFKVDSHLLMTTFFIIKIASKCTNRHLNIPRTTHPIIIPTPQITRLIIILNDEFFQLGLDHLLLIFLSLWLILGGEHGTIDEGEVDVLIVVQLLGADSVGVIFRSCIFH